MLEKTGFLEIRTKEYKSMREIEVRTPRAQWSRRDGYQVSSRERMHERVTSTDGVTLNEAHARVVQNQDRNAN